MAQQVEIEKLLGQVQTITGLPSFAVKGYLSLKNNEIEDSLEKINRFYSVASELYKTGHCPVVIAKALTQHHYRGVEGRLESVASLITQGKYDEEILLMIAQKAIN